MDECSICYGQGTYEDEWGDFVICPVCAGWISLDENASNQEAEAAIAAAKGE
jgi:uncharacterized Zn ribbon protein